MKLAKTLFAGGTALGLALMSMPAAQAAPGTPRSVAATAGVNSIRVVWDSPETGTPTGYDVACADPNGASPVQASATRTARAYEFKSLPGGLTYVCSVAAKDAAGSSAPVSAEPVVVLGVPGAPQLIGADAGEASVTLVFTAPPNTGGVPVLDYWASCDANTVVALSSPVVVPTTGVSGKVTCQVKARNAVGLSPASNSMTATPGQRPSGARVTGITIPETGVLEVAAAASAPASYPITSWSATCWGTAGDTLTASAQTAKIKVTGTTNGYYTCTASATNAYGASAPSLPYGPVKAVPVLAAPQPPAVAWVRSSGGATATLSYARYDGAQSYTVTCRSSVKNVTKTVKETTAALALVPAEWKCTLKATVGEFTTPESSQVVAAITPAKPKVTGGKGAITAARPAGLTKWSITCTPSKGKAVSKSGDTSEIKITGLTPGAYRCVAAGNGVKSEPSEVTVG